MEADHEDNIVRHRVTVGRILMNIWLKYGALVVASFPVGFYLLGPSVLSFSSSMRIFGER